MTVLETRDVDAGLAELQAGARAWSRLPIAARRELLLELHAGVAAVADEWVALACRHKGIGLRSPLAGEEWMSGPYVVLACIRGLASTLGALQAGRDPLGRLRVRTRPDGQVAVRVLPADSWDRLLFSGYHAEVWMQPGVSAGELRATTGRHLRDPGPARVALVLGAGNISSIAPLDILHQLYSQGDAVILKLNPVTAYLQPVLERAFAPYLRGGYLRIVAGGADLGAYLAHHDAVGAVHMTGSAAVHDAIVFGTGDDGARRKAEGRPRLHKPITSELGGVSPTIVAPGRWRERDLRYQAQHVATQKLHNSGFNCVAAQVLVLPDDWPQADAFLALVREALRRAPARPAYYPGAGERQRQALREHPDAQLLGGKVPRTLVTGLDPLQVDEPAFTREVFGPVLAVTRLPGPTAAEFLDAAVAFANDRLAGTLAANLIAEPRTLRRLGGTLEDAIARLRYGTVAINCWTAVAYLGPRATWGGFPGGQARDIASGIGVVHNVLGFERPEKTVVCGPFRPFPRSILGGEPALSPKPPWFLDNRTAHTTAERLTRFEAAPGWRRLPPLLASALRG